MCRASKVDRLVYKYPEGDDPVTDFENNVNSRGMMQNARWFNNMGNPDNLNRNSDTSLNTVYFIPDTVSLEQLRSNIDVSTIADIEYLRDKFISGLGLPKGFLLADGGPARGEALIEQDIAFARKLPYIQNAFLEGMHSLLTKISYYCGADLNTLKINLHIDVPHRLTDKATDQFNKGMDLVKKAISFFKEINPNFQLSDVDLKVMFQKAGLDPDIFNIPNTINKNKPSEQGGIDGTGGADLSGFGDVGGAGEESTVGAPGGEETGGNGAEPEGFDSQDIGTKPFGESYKGYMDIFVALHKKEFKSLKESLDKKELMPFGESYDGDYRPLARRYVSLDENLTVHYNLFKTFVHE
jgi:hypothetical protein